MIIRTSLLLQSLMVGMVPRDDSSSSSESLENLDNWDGGFFKQRLTPIPDPKDAATMARFIVHQASKFHF